METGNNSWIHYACQWLRGSAGDGPAERVRDAIAVASYHEIENLLEVLTANFGDLSRSPQRFRLLMQVVAARSHSGTSSALAPSLPAQPLNAADLAERETAPEQPAIDPSVVVRLYEQLNELDETAAAHTLQILAAQADEESIGELAEIIRSDPPQDWKMVALALSPLWNAPASSLELFFARLDHGYLQPSTMCVLLDLAGYAFRKGKISVHPWIEGATQLSGLLTSVVTRLQTLERDPTKFGTEVKAVQRVLTDSVALTVSLCDALGLVGDTQAEDSLLQALELSHRRIHTEAAGALARLGCERGKQRLIELANDPVARLRAVHYAEELGFAEEIEESLRLPTSLAESELVAWLAHADQFGIPPNHIELIDSRTMYWPSYEQPCDCYLFRFEYELPGGMVSNMGLAGPATHAFQADLSGLQTDDIYAAFAGWQAEHEDIYEVPMALLNSAQRREADRLLAELEQHQLEVIEALALTFFLGEVAVLAIVERAGRRASAITDGLELLQQSLTDSPQTLTPNILLAIYRGRKILRTFNS
jgi:hypothetical protein